MGKHRLTHCLSAFPVKALYALLLVSCIVFFLPPQASALGLLPALSPVEGLDMTDYYQVGSEGTSGVTDLEIVADYACNNGVASGSIYRSDRCATTLGFAGIFSGVICRVESILGQTIGELYCATSYRAEKPFLALLILYITVYGAMVILGMNQARLPEAISHVFKIGMVSIFILNAPLALGVGYKFYISAAQTAAGLAFNAFEDQSAQASFASDLQEVDPTRASEATDAGYLESRNAASAANQSQGASQWADNADRMFFMLIVYILRAMGAIIILIVILFFVAPTIFFMLLTFFAKLFQAIFQIITGYLLALVGLTFLFSLAPIMVPLWLFRFSQKICQTWLKYLASYAIQIAICMIFIALFTRVDFVSQLQQMGTLGRQTDVHIGVGWLQQRFMIWTLCRVERDGDDGTSGEILYYRYDALSGGTVQAQAWNGYPRCIPTYTYQQAISGERLPPTISQEEIDALKELQDDGDSDAKDVEQSIKRAIEKANDDNIIPLWEVLADGELIAFFMVRLLAIITLTFIMTLYLKKVPSVAEWIANTAGSGKLGGGEIDPSSPSIQASSNPYRDNMANDPFNLQGYLRNTKEGYKQARAKFVGKQGKFFGTRNTLGFAGNALMTPLALLGLGARKRGGYFRNLRYRGGNIVRSGAGLAYAGGYRSLAVTNELRKNISTRLSRPAIHANIAHNKQARALMMDDMERRQMLWEGEQLTRTREDSQYDELGQNLRNRRNRRRQQRAQANQQTSSNSRRPNTHQRPNTTSR